MRRGLVVGFLLGFLSVTALNAQEIYSPMTALRRVIVLMEELVQTSHEIATNTRVIASRGR